MAPLVPAGGARIARGQLISADNRHLLVVASPAESSTATEFAARIMERIDAIAAELKTGCTRPAGPGRHPDRGRAPFAPRSTTSGSSSGDIGLAVTVSTVGIAALLFVAFCRPAVGLFALLPALGGTMLATFIFSLFHRSISILVLGFGGAIISFSVDQGIVYLLFLDRPQATSGKAASHEVRSMGLLAVLTTVAAFGTLCFSGFPVFVQLGQFTMLGLGLCFLIVHLVFPRIFPVPAARGQPVAAPAEARRRARRHGPGRFLGRALFAGVMALFAKPVFDVSLQAMNTVGAETMAAEKQLADVWGGMFDKVYVLTEGRSIEELQDQGDRLIARIDADLQAGVLSSGFAPSMIAPGAELRRRNFDAWRAFWSPGRVDDAEADAGGRGGGARLRRGRVRPLLRAARRELPAAGADTRVLEQLPGFLGIARSPDDAAWIQVSTLTTGPAYDSRRFFDDYRGLGQGLRPAALRAGHRRAAVRHRGRLLPHQPRLRARDRGRLSPGRGAHAGLHAAVVWSRSSRRSAP